MSSTCISFNSGQKKIGYHRSVALAVDSDGLTNVVFEKVRTNEAAGPKSAIAQARPDDNFLGIEVHGPGVGALLKRIDELGLSNVRVVRHDAVEVIAAMIPHASLAGIHAFFPDPWPKKRHHKRRLLQSAFVRELALRLAPGGYLHAATDWEDYADEILAILSAEPLPRGRPPR